MAMRKLQQIAIESSDASSVQDHSRDAELTTNGTSHFYSPLAAAGFPPATTGAAAGHSTHYHTPPQGHMAPPPPAQQQTGTQQSQQSSGNQQQQQPPQQQQQPPNSMSHSATHSPSPPNSSYHKDERTQRQHTKLLRKLEKQREFNSAVSTPTHSPSPRRNDQQLNGHHNNSTSSSNNNNNSNSNNNSHQLRQQQPQHPSQQQQQQQQLLNNHLHNSNNHGRRMTQRNGSAAPNNNNTITAALAANTSAASSHQQQRAGGGGAGGASSVATSDEGEENSSLGAADEAEDEEEDYQATIIEQLSAIQKPEVTDITSRSAKIIWEAPPALNEPTVQLINIRDLRYNVLLSDRAKECKYKSLYKGSSYDCIVQDLQPGQEYVVRLQVHYEHLQGSASEPTEFTTPACEPDQPLPPRLIVRTKNSLHLRWTNPPSNGAPIQHYVLEFDEGKTGAAASAARHLTPIQFVEAAKTKSKQYILTKLQPSTVYNFRLAAVNEVGPSLYSTICSFSTAGNPPTAPKAPALQAVTSSSLRLVWERRQSDGGGCVYVLQMLDRDSGHGYLNMYNGPDCAYECCQLRRATAYYFRLRAENEAGASPWSSEVAYKTASERPGRPGKPHAKGKIHGTHFRARWDPPADTGGVEVLRYFLEINAGGAKFERIYAGVEPETTCDRLQPGTTYQLRAACEGPGGVSAYSEVAHITSEAIVPAAPPPPYYDNPPGPYAAVLRLDKPDYTGGAPVLEFEVQIRRALDAVPSDTATTPNTVYRGKDAYCVVKDLQPGCSYEVQVRALNRIGAGAWSSWFRFSAAAAPPTTPESLRVVVKSATHLLVSWQEPSNCNGAPVTEYRLESATASAADEAPAAPTSSAFHTCYQGLQTSADLRNLLPFTLYYFRVNACNVAGVSKWTPLVNTRTPAAVPAAPQIRDCEFSSNEATLSWSQPDCNGSPITAYTIEFAERTVTTPDAATEYTIDGLTPETSYKFRVQAVNAIGAGAYSAYTKVTTLPSPPAPPRLECSGVAHNFIKLKWGDGRNLDFTKFYVEMYVQRAKDFQVVYSGTSCMCKVNKLQERTAYTFRICAGNDRAGIGEYSEEYVFSTTATLPSGIKAPRVAQGVCVLGGAGGSGIGATGNGVGSSSTSGSSGGVIPSGLLPETPSFITELGNLMLGVPLTLEWQHSKNSFADRVEYLLQYAIGKDGDFKKIYRGIETKFTIENLEPGALYQFRVCPIRVTSGGEDLAGAYTSAFRYQVPPLPSLEDIDSSLLSSAAAAASAFGGVNAAAGSAAHSNAPTCHGHSHHHAHHSHHAHHPHTLHSHHNSRHSGHQQPSSGGGGAGGAGGLTNSTLHHRSVSASAVGSSSNSHSHSSSSSSNNNTLLMGNNAIGFIPLGGEMGGNFASCDDPNHHHHHHHHHAHTQFHNGVHEEHLAGGVSGGGGNTNSSSSGGGGGGGGGAHPSAASLLAASAGQLFANNPVLLQAAAAHVAANCHSASMSAHHAQHVGALRRFVTKLGSIYTNRKRFTDQEKAVIFMVSFLFFTFLFATLVKMFMR